MDPSLGARTTTPRLIDIRPPRSPSINSIKGYTYSISEVQNSHMSINPTLLSRRRTSRPHNQGAIDTVPEMRRFSSEGRQGTRSKSQHGNSQKIGAVGSAPPSVERESMRELAEFLMYHPPPPENQRPPTPETPRRKFSLFGKKPKKAPKQGELLQLPDTAVAARTGKGVQYIAISIPSQHDYLGNLMKTGCLTPPESSSEPRSPSSGNEREPIVVQKPLYKPKSRNITPPPDLQPVKTNDTRAVRHSWAPGLAHNKGALEEAGSNAAISLSGYFHHNQTIPPPTSIYAVEPHSLNGRSNTVTASQVRRTSFQDVRRNNSMGSIHPPLPKSKKEGPLKVVNRTPSPHAKPAHQGHKKSRSRSTVHSIASTAAGISKSLKSTPESFASSPTATVFGTAETVDFQSIRAGSSLPALTPTERPNLTLTTSRSYVTTVPVVPPPPPIPHVANVAVNRSKSNGSDHRSEISSRTSRRDRVRARRERDLAELRQINNPKPEKPAAAPTHAWNQSESFKSVASLLSHQFYGAPGDRRVGSKSRDHGAGPSGTHRLYLDASRSSPDLVTSAKHHSSTKHHYSKSMKNLKTAASKTPSVSRIMVVADLPPSSSSDPFSVTDSIFPTPHPKRSTKSLGKIAYSHSTTQTPSTSQTHLHMQPQAPPSPPPIPTTLPSRRRPRPTSAPSPRSNTPSHLDLTREDIGLVNGPREHELDVRMRIIERDTEVLLHTLGGMARGLEGVADHPVVAMGSRRGSACGSGVVRQKSGATARTSRTGKSVRTMGTVGSRRREVEREREERERGAAWERDLMEPVMREIQMLAPRVSMESLGGRVDEMVEDDRISL